MAKKSYESTRNELLSKALTNPLDAETIKAVAEELEQNPKYSLDPDPTGDLGLSMKEKMFIQWYLQHRNIAVAAQLTGVSVEDAMEIYRSFTCQAELRRIDMAWKLRQINMSTMSLDQIGSMLTSYVFDQLPEADRLNTKDKISAMKMIMDIHALKQKVVEDATPVDVVDVETKVKDLSVDALKELIQKTQRTDNENAEKEELIKKLDDESRLSNEDLHYLRSLSIEQLKELLEEKKKVKAPEPKQIEVIPNPFNNTAKLTPLDESDYVTGDDITGD